MWLRLLERPSLFNRISKHTEGALYRHTRIVTAFGIGFGHSKSNFVLLDWASVVRSLVFRLEELTSVDGFSNSGYCLCKDGGLVLEMRTHIQGLSGVCWIETFMELTWYITGVERLFALGCSTLTSVTQSLDIKFAHWNCWSLGGFQSSMFTKHF